MNGRPGGAEDSTPESAGLRRGSRLSTSGLFGDRTRSLRLSKQKGPLTLNQRAFVFKPGGVLLSHCLTAAVSSALEGLTSVFEMGTGVTPPAWPPGT
jgi:hypothetical protein